MRAAEVRLRSMIWMMLALVACGGDKDGDGGSTESCNFPCQYSTANSGGLCQANAYCDDGDFAVYCGEEADGTYSCDCGAAAESPPSFSSDDFCDLEGEDRMCEALAKCSNWDF